MEQKLSDLLTNTFSDIMDFLFADEDIRHELLTHILESKDEGEEITREDIVRLMQKAVYGNYFIYTYDKGILDYCIENNTEFTDEQKQLINSLKNHRFSTFKIIKKHKDYFELHRLTSGVLYDVYPLEKMWLRDVTAGDYIVGAIIDFKDKYYLIDIEQFLTYSEEGAAVTAAFIEISTATESFYEDNLQNFEKAEAKVKELNGVFIRHFGSKPVITTKNCADKIIKNIYENIEITTNIEKPEKLGYFDKKADEEDKAPFEQFMENDTNFDVGLFVDPELGLFEIPYYGTFREIFFADDPSLIENYQGCIYDFFWGPAAPPSAVMYVYNEVNNREKFLSIIKEPLGYDEPPEIEDLLRITKSEFYKNKRFSFIVIHTISPFIEEFQKKLKIMRQEIQKQEKIQSQGKIGRNDPCPCGSGKKYKKCCLK